MSYGYVYTAQICLGADYNQAVKAISEAEAYHGPSLVIGYAPCINHGLRVGMGKSLLEAKNAVLAGYWHTFRFNPAAKAEGKNPFTLDSKAPVNDYKEFIGNEVRYSSLKRAFPERADELFDKAEGYAKEKYKHLTHLVEMYGSEVED